MLINDEIVLFLMFGCRITATFLIFATTKQNPT